MDEQTKQGGMAPPLAAVDAFKELAAQDLAALEANLELVSLNRGDILIREGAQSDALYVVVSGRFQVRRSNRADPLAEIGPGQPIGEIAFFSGLPRTASVRAERDSLVLKLTREDFDRLAKSSPEIWRTVTGMLARRLAASTEARPVSRDATPRTIAICRAGPATVPDDFIGQLRAVFTPSRFAMFDAAAVEAALPAGAALDSSQATSFFNELETRYEFLIYVADGELTAWSQKAIRQADLVLLVGSHRDASDALPTPNAIERFAFRLHGSGNLRLVLLHATSGTISGTWRWLEARPQIRMHHHVALHSVSDYERLARFITGRALGLVACGGGAFCSAHVGVYQALREAGFDFDMMGGTSGGAAMTAAFARGLNSDDIDRRIHRIFVEGRAMRRWTWPRYSLLDHSVFDRMLEVHYTSIDIADLWIPFFAVSTNLSDNTLHLHRRGPLWEAVRASASIPALLPPFFTERGEMLVDGSLLDNVPVQAMRGLKSGPNVVVSFEPPELSRFGRECRTLPSRAELLWHKINPFSRLTLPPAPSPVAVLMRSLMVGRSDFSSAIGAQDLVLNPPLPPDVGVLDWHAHTRLRTEAYAFSQAELAKQRELGHPLANGLSAGRAAPNQPDRTEG